MKNISISVLFAILRAILLFQVLGIFGISFIISLSGCKKSSTGNAAGDADSWVSPFQIGNLPIIPKYPWRDPKEIESLAQALSDDLELYIRDWKLGRVDATLPESIIPQGRNKTHFASLKLLDPEKSPDKEFVQDGNNLFVFRPAHPVIHSRCQGHHPDPHCSYMLPTISYGPFGSKYIIKGQFPRCRYFSIQPTLPFDARFFYTLGVGELSIVDCDILPDSGNINDNPFRPGGSRNVDRNTPAGKYTITLHFAKGDAVALNPDHVRPFYRQEAMLSTSTPNVRYVGPMVCAGPLGDPGNYDPHYAVPVSTKDPIDMGKIWIRYYGPDKASETDPYGSPYGGVPLMTYTQELATGEKFVIWCDRKGFQEGFVDPIAPQTEDPNGVTVIPGYWGKDYGWWKQWGIMGAVVTGTVFESLPPIFAVMYTRDQLASYSRELIRGWTGMGEDQPAPGCYESSSTCCNNINYLLRGFYLKPGMVFVYIGKLPTFPDTRNATGDSNATMLKAEMRYLSFTSYDPDVSDAQHQANTEGLEQTSICDDEINLVSSTDRRYVICYSRPDDRPTNTAKVLPDSVTGAVETPRNYTLPSWVDAGKKGLQKMTLRWLSVGHNTDQTADQWSFAYTPHEHTVTWSKTSRDGTQYDPNITFMNNHTGWLKEYQPVAHYMRKETFQGLGSTIDAIYNGLKDQVVWEND